MILLDTNVVTELISPRIALNVARFADHHPLSEFFLPSVVIAEIRYGLRRLPNGRRRQLLEEQFTAFLAQGFADRVLVFDADCADGYAVARTTREQVERPISVQDALIGGMALAHGATLATRNLADFDGYGLTLINPWEE